MSNNPDVIIIGAGGDGPVCAWGLAELGLEVLILEAGPWHGHEKWPQPHEVSGARKSKDYGKLSNKILEREFSQLEHDMNNVVNGKLRWGPAKRSKAPWFRVMTDPGMILQVAGVGGTTLHYYGNHPRAYPHAIDDQGDWPINYEELIPYYQLLEDFLPVKPAPTAPRDELFYQGCKESGWDLLDEKNVNKAGYRPMPNALLQPDEKLSGDYDGSFEYPDVSGSTMAMNEHLGDALPKNAPVDQKARRSPNTSYIPEALKTGNLTIQPNSFVTEVLTDETDTATGVEYRHTWSGETEVIEADTIVMAGGCIETPRLWKNSGLPDNDWVGRGLTTHWLDFVSGVFEEDTLRESIGMPQTEPHIGQSGSARVDVPGLGAIAVNTFPPGITAGSIYSFSRSGFNRFNDVDESEPWDTRGRLSGKTLKEVMADYRKTLTLIIHTDDRPDYQNRITTDTHLTDEHGPVPRINWNPRVEDSHKRRRLAEVGAEVLRNAGAKHVHRVDSHPILLHLQSSMPMGKVTDSTAEAKDVDRLFIADHSVLSNSLGGPNPTHTGQALALRTAEKITDKYFPSKTEDQTVLTVCNP